MASLVRRNRRFRRRPNPYKRLRRCTQNDTDYIVNLSSHTLTKAQRQVLNKGLGYALAVPDIPDYTDSCARFSRTVRIKEYFQDYDGPARERPPFKAKSTWIPPLASPGVESYLSNLAADLGKVRLKPHRNNLNKAQRIALSELKSLNLVIRRADKGSCVVVEDRSQYIEDGEEHLKDSSIYQEVDGDPTHFQVTLINEYIKDLRQKGHISPDMAQFLTAKPEEVRTQQMYFLRKVHKTPMSIRPIVSGTGGPTEKVSQLLDYFASPHVKHTPAYLKDSTHLVTMLEELTLPDEVILATVDVVGLYLHIPHNEGVDATVQCLYSLVEEEPPFPPEVCRALFGIVLERNFFEFNGRMYHQVQGTAMGTRVAPTYANLFMAALEKSILSPTHPDLLLWRRFIDDIFLLWRGTEEALLSFLTHLNSIHPTIQFTFTTSPTSVDFMDLTLYKGPRFAAEKKLDVKPYFKHTNRFQYLHYNSSHPRSLFRGLAKGEFVRMLRHSSSEKSFTQACRMLTQRLQARGYPLKLITSSRAAVPYCARDDSLNARDLVYTLPNPSPGPSPGPGPGHGPGPDAGLGRPKDPGCLPFITKYSDRVTRRSIREALDKGPPGIKPTIAFTRGKTLANSLVRARLRGVRKPQASTFASPIRNAPIFKTTSKPCGSKLCGTCRLISGRGTVYNSTQTKWFKVPAGTSCNTSHCIYMLFCNICSPSPQYVGQTARPLKERLSGHRQAQSKHVGRPLYNHFAKRGHSFNDVRAVILESGVNIKKLLEREAQWIARLKSTWPHGLNDTHDKRNHPAGAEQSQI